MLASRKAFSGLAALASMGFLLAGCSDGVDLEVNAPLLNAAGVNVKEAVFGKPAPTPDLPEHAPLVLPPPNADLPEPGQAPAQPAAANGSQWPNDPAEAKKQAAKDAKAKRDQYCKNGDWSGKGNIDEFNKNAGQDTHCRPTWARNAIDRASGQEPKQ